MKIEFQNTRCIVKKMKKVGKSREKTTKSATNLIQNKPNSPNVQTYVTFFTKMIYTIFASLTKVKSKPNQTQYKPNSNPIPKRPKMNLRNAIKMNYKKITRFTGQKTNPNQTQNKANQIYSRMPQLEGLWDSKMLVLDFSYIQGKLYVSEKINHWIFREKVYDSTNGFKRLLRALLRELRNSGKFRQRS